MRVIAFLLFLVPLATCGETLYMQTKVFAMTSTALDELNATVTGQWINDVVGEAVEYWRIKADIVFNITSSVEPIAAIREDDFHNAWKHLYRTSHQFLFSNDTFFNTTDLLKEGINIIFVKDLSELSDVIFNSALKTLVHPQNVANTRLAQHLGFALSLARVGCQDHDSNLMVPYHCNIAENPVIDACQIESARKIAKTGSPWKGQDDLECPCDGCGISTTTLASLLFGIGLVVLIGAIAAYWFVKSGKKEE